MCQDVRPWSEKTVGNLTKTVTSNWQLQKGGQRACFPNGDTSPGQAVLCRRGLFSLFLSDINSTKMCNIFDLIGTKKSEIHVYIHPFSTLLQSWSLELKQNSDNLGRVKCLLCFSVAANWLVWLVGSTPLFEIRVLNHYLMLHSNIHKVTGSPFL